MEKALGAFARLLIIGQQFWKKDQSLIPKHIWISQRLNNALIEVGLVEEKDHGFYVKGAEEAFAWILSRSINGQKGGLDRSIANKKGTSNDFNDLGASTGKHSEAQPSTAKPHTHTHPHTQIINTIDQSTTSCLIKFDLEILYKKYPKKVGKQKGLKKLSREIKTQTDFDNLSLAIDRYISFLIVNKTETQFVKQFDSFATVWKDYLEEDFGQSSDFAQKGAANARGYVEHL